jgi:hypothetical protein
MKMLKIISGGQTGADRAALDAGIAAGLEYGGSIPRGRRTEAGPLPLKYRNMTELASPVYRVRTEQNVIDAAATLIFTCGRPTGGTALTAQFARQHHKPYLVVDLEAQSAASAAALIRQWLKDLQPEVLNVAGPRESKCPGIRQKVYTVLQKALPRKRGRRERPA